MPVADRETPSNRARARIQNDEIILKVLKACKIIEIQKNLVDELNGYFMTSRDLAHPGHYKYGVNTKFRNPREDLTSVAGAMGKIQAFRDRVCEIQISCLDKKQKLDSWIRIGRNHIYDMYGFELKSRGSEAAQSNFIISILSPLYSRLDVLVAQLKQVDAILENLDKAHFNYKFVGEIGLKLVDRLEGGRTVTSHGA